VLNLAQLMVMEAMRLSLLDHEEHLRREAQNRNRNEGTAAESDPARASYLTVPGGETSNLSHSDDPTPSSSAPVSSASSSLSSNETHSRHQIAVPAPVPISQGSSFSIDPIAALQGMNNTSTSWRRQSSNPPPFTTLGAIMGAAATATTALGTGNTITNTNATTSTSNVTSLRPNSGLVATPAPLITIDDGSAGHDAEDTSHPAETSQLAKQNLDSPVALSRETDLSSFSNPTDSHASTSGAVSAVDNMVTTVDRRD
jgi:hypothetical protein